MFTKEFDTEEGDKAEYWAVIKFTTSVINKHATIVLGAWKNKNKYDNGKKPYIRKEIELPTGHFPFANNRMNNILEDIRTKIAEVDEFFVDAVQD